VALIENNKNNSEHQGVSILSKEETKQILTPFAFELDKSLFGLPLSVPWKRGLALLIDFIVIAMLAETPGELLALVIAITFFKLGSKKRAAKFGQKRGLGKLLLRVLGAFILFVVLISTLPDLFDRMLKLDESTSPESHIVQVDEQVTSSEVTTNKATSESLTDNAKLLNKEKEEPSAGYQAAEWLKGMLKELGPSFGWAALYFTLFTAIWNGQTPGKKVLNIQVIQLDGTPLSIWDSFGRYGGYGAGLATGLLGFLQIYWDPNRQAIHDKISSTVVIDLKKAKTLLD